MSPRIRLSYFHLVQNALGYFTLLGSTYDPLLSRFRAILILFSAICLPLRQNSSGIQSAPCLTKTSVFIWTVSSIPTIPALCGLPDFLLTNGSYSSGSVFYNLGDGFGDLLLSSSVSYPLVWSASFLEGLLVDYEPTVNFLSSGVILNSKSFVPKIFLQRAYSSCFSSKSFITLYFLEFNSFDY